MSQDVSNVASSANLLVPGSGRVWPNGAVCNRLRVLLRDAKSWVCAADAGHPAHPKAWGQGGGRAGPDAVDTRDRADQHEHELRRVRKGRAAGVVCCRGWVLVCFVRGTRATMLSTKSARRRTSTSAHVSLKLEAKKRYNKGTHPYLTVLDVANRLLLVRGHPCYPRAWPCVSVRIGFIFVSAKSVQLVSNTHPSLP
jgi:hypothetical protein